MKDKIKGILEDIKEIYYFKPLLDYITNLQEELKSANESISWWQNRFNAVEKENKRLKEENKRIFSKVNDDEILDCITNLQQENQDIKDTLQDKLDYIGHLKELCDKYEEEHNTKFNEWVFDKRENERLTQGVTLLTNKLIDMTKEKEDYKLRNKKAIEYIEIGLANEKEAEELLNILNDDNK